MLVFLVLAGNCFGVMYVLSVQYSCAVVSVFLWRESFITTGKKSSSRLSGGLCCCVSFWFWREIGFGCTYYYVLGVPYSCFLLLRESFITTGKKVLVVCLVGCAVVSVFGSGGKKVLVVHTTMYLEYRTVLVLCQFFSSCGK